MDHNAPPRLCRVASLAKRLEKSIVFPQVSKRLVPTCDPADRRDSTETLRGNVSCHEDLVNESIVDSAVPEVASRHPNPVVLAEANALAPRRFGSFEDDDENEPDFSDNGSWGSDEFLESGTDTWSVQDVDSASDVDSPGAPDKGNDQVDGQSYQNLQLAPRSPDLVSDTFIDLGNKALRRESDTLAPFEDFVDVKWNAAKHPPPALPPRPCSLSKAQEKRRCIFENLITTENSYVATLEHLVDDYDGKLTTADPKILDKDDRRSIFYMVRHLLQIHRTFQISLHDVATRWDQEESVALVFTACFSRVTVRRVYASYINNYDDAMERVKQLQASNKSFANFLNKQQRQSKFRLALNGLMVKPVQRFPQFILLLQDLLKHTEEEHPQFYHLQRAVSDVQALANFLNEKKRESQQKTEARNLMRDLHVQFVDMSKEEKRGLKILNVMPAEHETYSPSGALVLRSKQHLALFNVMVLCFTRDEANGKVQMLWSAPLASVTVQSCSITPNMKVSVRKNSIGTTVIQHRNRASSVVDGQAMKRYEELQALVHDRAILMQISGLASTLQRRYRGFNELRLEALCTHLQRLIQQKDDENRLTDSSFLELRVTSVKAQGITGPKRFVFDLSSPANRNAWVDRFMRQKLSEEEWNRPTWVARDEMCDPMDPFAPSQEAPLFIGSATVDISRNFGEVNCVMPVCLVNGTILKRYVWCGHECGGISIFSLYTHKPLITQNFPCPDLPPGGSFWCMELVPGAIDSPEPRHQADMVWAGTNTGQVFAFSLLEQERQWPFLRITTDGAVVSLCYAADRVFAGLENGLVVIYERDAKGYWSMRNPFSLGEHAVVKMAALPDEGGAVLMACEDVLFRISPDDTTQGFARDPLPMDGDEHIQDFVVGGQAAWVAFQNSLLLRLIHLKTYELMQTIDLNSTINLVDDKHRDFDESVTCLAMTKRLLLIGTRAGHLCKVPLQQTMPISSGPSSVAYHKHHGAIRFIVTFQNMVERLVRSVEEEEEEEEEEEDESEEEEAIEEELVMQREASRLGYERKPSVDVSSSRRLSLTPLKSKWMSNPNLLLSLQAADEENTAMKFENLMVDISMDTISEESSVNSTPAGSRKTSQVLMEAPQILRPMDIHSKLTKMSSVPSQAESDGKMWLEDTLIVTGGLGYYDIQGRRVSEVETEPCLNCWCE